MQSESNKQDSSTIIPPELAIRALRDNGYRNTAYALAELIDNSVQANADLVDVVCREEYRTIRGQNRRTITGIGVFDNGNGMSSDTLQLALQFGNGTHLTDRKGIGRFGMGLPNSSISQGRRVDVWSWRSGPDNAIHTYLDVDEIANGEQLTVPTPTADSLPEDWRNRTETIGTSGTFVLWSKFDEYRLTWRGAGTTLDHTGALIGRMYRKFISNGSLTIRLLSYIDDNWSPQIDQSVRVNDPLYLMENSQTPKPFNEKPMFQEWGEGEEKFTILYKKREHTVIVRMSWAKPETVPKDGVNRGSKPYGKHAARNLGVSIVRAGRELDLDAAWTNSYDPTERWWGVEVEFPPALDEIFGVTNNKQAATIFSSMAQFDESTEYLERETTEQYIGRIRDEGDPRAHLLPMVNHIRLQVQKMRERLGDQTKGKRGKGKRQKRHDEVGVEDTASTKFRERNKERNKKGIDTDHDNKEFSEQDREKLEKDLKEDKDYSDDTARDISEAVVARNRKVIFVTKSMDTDHPFFNVEFQHGGLTAVVFNTKHLLYKHLIEVLEPRIDEDTDKDLIDRVNTASDTIKLMFSAWARYEMEEVQHHELLSDIRQDWGRMARFFLSESMD